MAAGGQAEAEKLRRHLAALMRKNILLKRRHPVSLCCELFLAIGSTCLLAGARQLTKNEQAMEVMEELHLKQSMPVRLPDCAEFVSECSVELAEDSRQNPICVKGVTFGCKAPSTKLGSTGNAGVWVRMGCNGTFRMPGFPPIYCASGAMGKLHVCRGGHHGLTIDAVPECAVRPEHMSECAANVNRRACEDMGCCFTPGDRLTGTTPKCYRPKAKSSHVSRRLEAAAEEAAGAGGDSNETASRMSMLQGLLSKSPTEMRRLAAQFAIAGPGGQEFMDWLSASGHPWAANAKLFESAEAVEAHTRAVSYPARDLPANRTSLLCAAVVFDTPPSSAKVRYSLRFNATLGYDPNLPPLTGLMMSSRLITDSLVDVQKKIVSFQLTGITWYTQSGFLAMQRSVDTFLAEVYHTKPQRHGDLAGLKPSGSSLFGEDGRPHIVVPFPTARERHDIFSLLMPNILASFLLCSLAYSVNRMVTAVVLERELRLRDGMRMMGMHPVAFYLSWILTYLAVYLFVSVGVVTVLSVGSILPNASVSLLFVWLMLFAMASISYALVLSTLFSKAKTAATVGSVAFFSSSYLVHLATPASSPRFLRLISLLPPVAFELSAQGIADAESQGIGMTWQNIGLQAQSYHYSLWDGCLMLIVDAVLLLLVFLYLDQVAPREVGLQRPWYFPLQSSFWRELRGAQRNVGVPARDNPERGDLENAQEGSALVEQDIGEAAAAMARSNQTVELRKLTKCFGELQAVKGLNLVMYQGEIFALLGHNGAGKTTALSILCGLMQPTSGSCVVFGQELADSPAEVQKVLGVCPQHDVLWEELTCEEHLVLFAGFKGVPSALVPQEVAAMLQRVGLQGAAAGGTLAGRLSGGMKRKLSLGIAFLGGSRLVVLDEPTSGLDPYSRRMVWELLRAFKQGRATLLSTHYMDEADILGDRVAILHEGSLRCCGSPQFLKRAYDCGYSITFVKGEGCVADTVREAVCSHMPELASEVLLLSDCGKELILQFPFAAARHFDKALGSLEEMKTKLRVESYGVSVTTLEEVFLKVASGERLGSDSDDCVELEEVRGGASNLDSPPETTGGSDLDDYVELEEVGGSGDASRESLGHSQGGARDARGSAQAADEAAPSLLRLWLISLAASLRRFGALLLKRCRYGLRDRRGFVCQLLLPAGTLLALLSMMSAKLFHDMPPLELDVGSYNEYCMGSPKNMVDFSYLNSVGPEWAEAVLSPGKKFWQGDLRRFDPKPEERWESMEEEAIASTIPALVHNIFAPAIKKVIASKRLPPEFPMLELEEGPERRLAAAQRAEREAALREKLVTLRLAHAATELWAHSSRTHSVTAALADELLSTGRRLQGSDGMPRRRQRRGSPSEFGPRSSPGKFRHGPEPSSGRQFPSFGWPAMKNSSFRPGRGQESWWADCETVSGPELMLWASSDQDHDDQVSKDELKQALAPLMPHMLNAHLLEARAKGHLNASQEEIDDVAAEVLLEALDRDHDGAITEREFCSTGAVFRKEFTRLYNVAARFSKQILDHDSQCARYGAFFVIQGPRSEKSPEWATSADAVIFVNTSSSHSAPAFQAALSNAHFARLGIDKQVSLTVHPFAQTKDEANNLEQIAMYLLAIYITFCLSFIPGGIVHFVVKERVSGAQQLQILGGASRLSYWSANLIYDLLLYTVPALCIPAALLQFGFQLILTGECGRALFVILALFGPAVASFSYLVAFFFKDHSKASNAILTLCLVGASVLATVLFIISMINFDPTYTYPMACDRPTAAFPEGNCRVPMARLADRILGPLFRLVPTVCIYQGLFSIVAVANLQATMPQGAMEAMMSAMGEAAPHVSTSAFSYEWAGEPMLYLAVEAVVYFLLTVLVDVCLHSPRHTKLFDAAVGLKHVAAWFKFRGNRYNGAREAGLLDVIDANGGDRGDRSVELEYERTGLVVPEAAALHLWEVEKTYQSWLARGSSKKLAVQGVSFCVHAGEVFCLLGHNGAGKTSAMKCLVGEIHATAGRVHVGGHDMEMETSLARRRIGYCPQFDALLELLTVRDHLELYASLKGITGKAVDQALQDFHLEKMAHRRADLLSGGNKRKLSAAIALLGSTTLAVLDEPSCGLDPKARRALWDAVRCAVTGGGAGEQRQPPAVLLTTHLMEEAEALSTRVGIMANGKLLTVGTSQEIKQRYGAGHELCITLIKESEQALTEALLRLGQGALRPTTALGPHLVTPLINSDEAKGRAYARPRCVVRAQMETVGHVEASVLAEWWLQQDRGEAVEAFLGRLVGERAELAENFGPYWRFRLPRKGVPLPELFRNLEEHGPRLCISEYTISQATLEQIFNSLAGQSEEANT